MTQELDTEEVTVEGRVEENHQGPLGFTAFLPPELYATSKFFVTTHHSRTLNVHALGTTLTLPWYHTMAACWLHQTTPHQLAEKP